MPKPRDPKKGKKASKKNRPSEKNPPYQFNESGELTDGALEALSGGGDPRPEQTPDAMCPCPTDTTC